ncbi:MAG: phage antirepressor N-terminal domain-containing protein [Dolichospermum sp.]
MENQAREFLEFNGKNINVLAKDGQYWVAIKPICEALGVDYEHQRKSIQNDDILSELPSNQTVVASDGKLREMVCLPEIFIYGWLFSIKSKSKELNKYKLECYKVLYNYFHGATTKRLSALRVKTEAEIELETLKAKLEETEIYQQFKEAESKVKGITKELKEQDKDLLENQLSLFKIFKKDSEN